MESTYFSYAAVALPVVVGRDEELAAIDVALGRAAGGRGGVLFLVGEAGLGKSRMAREAEDAARAKGVVVLTGRAVSDGRASAYRALSEALLAVSRFGGLPRSPELDPFVGYLARIVPQWRASRASMVEMSDVLLAEGLLRLLRLLSGENGCLLVLEDLHWADAGTLAVVEYLADNLDAEPVLCLGTVRTGESSRAEKLVRLLAARRAVTLAELSPLGDDEVASMAAACLQAPQLSADLGQMVTEWAGGVPFLVEEILAALTAGGALTSTSGGWAVARAVSPVVPQSFAQSVQARLDELGDDCRHLVEAAAVLGRHFDWSLLSSLTSLPQDAVVGCLRRAVGAHLLVAEAGFRFRHALTREAVSVEYSHPSGPSYVDVRSALCSTRIQTYLGSGVTWQPSWPRAPGIASAPRRSCFKRDGGR